MRELKIVEGDALYSNQIQKLEMFFFKSFETVNVKEETIDENLINLLIEVEENKLVHLTQVFLLGH